MSSEKSAAQAETGGLPTDPLLVAFQQVAKGGLDALKQLGRELKSSGRKIDVSQLTKAAYAGQAVLRAVKKDPATDEELKELGEVLQAPGASEALITLPPGIFKNEAEGASVVPLLTDRLIEQLPHDIKTFARQRRPPLPVPAASAMAGPRRPTDPDDSNEAGLRVPAAESFWIKLAALAMCLTTLAYCGLRIWDLTRAHRDERQAWHTFYRVVIVAVEVLFGVSAVGALISRTRRQRLEALPRVSRDLPFAANDVLTLLMVTDEDERAIAASVESHYAAARVGAGGKAPPFRAVLVAEDGGEESQARRAHRALEAAYPSLLLFTKAELAEQEYVLTADDAEAQAALNVVLEDNMYLGQVIFYSLDRLFLQYGHAVSDAAVVVMPASSVVDGENYYTYVIDLMQRPGFACVSTPTVARNKLAATDFVDVSCAAYERDTLSAVAADEKFAINAGCFAARGYSLWRVLRRMEMENVDTQNLLWLTYAMHIEARQATVATMTQHAPRTSVLAPTHGPTVLSQVLDRQVEGFDVARIFDRERSFLSWNLFNPLRAPHDSARATVVMEAAIVVVILVTALGGIAPWSTEALAVPAAFLVHYGAMIVLALASPFALSVTRAGVTMRNRVLVSAHAWLYFLNLSRFGVDRRGHFRAVGETTTADLVTYKEKQRQEKEEAAAKEVEDAKKAKETAARQKEELKSKKALDTVAKKNTKKELAEKAKAAAAADKEARAEAKRKEKLRRARRGPKRQVMDAVAEGAAADDGLDAYIEMPRLDDSVVGSYVSGAISGEIRPAQAVPPAQPVAEGFFGRKKGKNGAGGEEPGVGAPLGYRSSSTQPVLQAEDADSGETDGAASVARGPAKAAQRSLLPSRRPKDAKVTKYDTPKATSGGGRKGTGSSHRPHRGVKLLSVPVAAVLALAAVAGLLVSLTKVVGGSLPENYTSMEIVAARHWYIACGVLGLFVLLAVFVYASLVARMAWLTSNRVCGGTILLLSLLCVLLVGALPFLAAALLNNRCCGAGTEYDFGALHADSMVFFAAQAAGEPTSVPFMPAYKAGVRSDSAVVHPETQEALNGGWVTGPGLSKVTYPQAIAVTEMAFALITHFAVLSEMPSAAPGPLGQRNAADDLRDTLKHGAVYLLNCHNPATDSLVSHVANVANGGEQPAANVEWLSPGARQNADVFLVNGAQQQGVETFAAVTAAYAALSVALRPWGEDDLTGRLRTRAEATFETMRASTGSYASIARNSAIAATWPSDGRLLADDKLLASSLMLLSTGRQEYRNAMNGYYTLAQQERAAAGRTDDFRLYVDDHWWLAQAVLFHADRANTRYSEQLRRLSRAWAGTPGEFDPPDGLARVGGGLVTAQPPWWGDANAYVSPGPLGMTARAMSLIALHASSQQRESEADRAATCFAQGQLRHIMGLNEAGRSYVAGVTPDGVAAPRQPVDRITGPPNFADGGNNPQTLVGALVHGPSPNGAYTDRRTSPQHTGVSILNNSPLSTLLASLQSRGLDIQDCIGLRPREALAKSTSVADDTQGESVFT